MKLPTMNLPHDKITHDDKITNDDFIAQRYEITHDEIIAMKLPRILF